jgi:hypothetical protein
LASKRWEKVGRQELPSTPFKQEIDPTEGNYSNQKVGRNGAQLPLNTGNGPADSATEQAHLVWDTLG